MRLVQPPRRVSAVIGGYEPISLTTGSPAGSNMQTLSRTTAHCSADVKPAISKHSFNQRIALTKKVSSRESKTISSQQPSATIRRSPSFLTPFTDLLHTTPGDQAMHILRLKNVIEKTGLARSTIYKYVDAGTFPKPIPLGGRSVGWLISEIHDWILDAVQERDYQISFTSRAAQRG